MKDTYYDEISEGYEELHRDEQEKKMKIILSEVKVDPADSLLDVGCGTGITTIPWTCKRTGIDPAKKLLLKAHDKEHINYVLAAAEKIPFPNKSFDIVTSVTAIQNFSDIKKGLSEIKRVGKERFVLTYLRKSSKAKSIESLITQMFNVKKRIEEEKDIIFIC
jgi:ubiquinone/menaquinone biosynthesis C-methylase UbiE